MAIPKLKDDALERHYRAMFDLFASPGWSALMEDLEAVEATLNKLITVKDQRELDNRQGQLANILWMKAQPEMHDHAYRQILVDEAKPEEQDTLIAELDDLTFGVAKVIS
jgi:hypothetical protein